MTQRSEFDLLQDLAKLMVKYGPEPFRRLSQWASSPASYEEFSRLLALSADAAPEKAPRVRTSGRSQSRPLTKLLTSVEVSDPSKYKLLVAMTERLRAKTLLPTMKDLRWFMAEVGANPSVSAREKAIPQLVRKLAELPLEDIQMRLERMAESAAPRSDLAGWSKLILGPSRDQK